VPAFPFGVLVENRNLNHCTVSLKYCWSYFSLIEKLQEPTIKLHSASLEYTVKAKKVHVQIEFLSCSQSASVSEGSQMFLRLNIGSLNQGNGPVGLSIGS